MLPVVARTREAQDSPFNGTEFVDVEAALCLRAPCVVLLSFELPRAEGSVWTGGIWRCQSLL